MYQPDHKLLRNYAKVLVNFALGGGEGIKAGEVVQVVGSETCKPLYFEVCKAVWESGGHVLHNFSLDDQAFNLDRAFFEIASDEQLEFFPAKQLKGLTEEMDHQLFIISEADKHALEGIEPSKIMKRSAARKPYMQWRDAKENRGEFTWTLGLYGTEAMAREANMSLEEYWEQIIQACFLDDENPVARWKEVESSIKEYVTKLDALKIDKLHLEGEDMDLWVKIGERRKWMGGSGRNIPSFEIFTSPDWRGTEGWIRFNQPLYRYGNLIEGVELEFKEGLVTSAKATRNQEVLEEMIAAENANKVGEFSLTDRRFSRITRFMAETLYDENVGGEFGNTHIAVGSAYQDCFDGDPSKPSKEEWEALGYNIDSPVHSDIVSTTDRKVTAVLPDGSERVIYEKGEFRL